MTTVTLFGTEGKPSEPVDHSVVWMYPQDASTLRIDICSVRVIDDVRLRFDFDAHQWVAEQELQADTDHEPATGQWVEVARWSGNAPSATDKETISVELLTEIQKETIKEALRLMREQTMAPGGEEREYCDSLCCHKAEKLLGKLVKEEEAEP